VLYATTRNNTDAFTAQRVLTMKRGSDGGLFVPYRIPRFSEEDILALGKRSFNSNFSDVMNLLFGSHLTGYDIDFTMGRYSVRLQQLGQKIVMGESWHNTDWDFTRMVKDLSQLVLSDAGEQAELKGWAETGVRIAVLFGMFGELIRAGLADKDKKVDVAVVSGDFSAPMAAWYARSMGLPIANIVCCCNENGGLWNLFSHGQLRTDTVAVTTLTPGADIIAPENLERMLYAVTGSGEAERYGDCARRGTTYYLPHHFQSGLRRGMHISVVSQPRMLSTISNVFTSAGYLLSPYDALCHAGLLDYRARTGSGRCAVLLSERSPSRDADTVAAAAGLSAEELKSGM